jgi:hypothetical protein
MIEWVNVMCNDEQHRIGLKRGRLVLFDHHLRRERIRVAYGAETPYCLEILKNFSYFVREYRRAPQNLSRWLYKMNEVHQVHMNRKTNSTLAKTFNDLTTRAKMLGWFQAVPRPYFFNNCSYALPPSGTFDFEVVPYAVGKPIDPPALVLFNRKKRWQDDNGRMQLYLPWRWWRQVHLQGLAVVQVPMKLLPIPIMPLQQHQPNVPFVPLFVQDVFSFEEESPKMASQFNNAPPSNMNWYLHTGVYRAVVRVISQRSNGDFFTQRAEVRNGIVYRLLPEEISSMQWPTNRDF